MSNLKLRLFDIAQDKFLKRLETMDVGRVRDYMSEKVNSFKSKDGDNLRRTGTQPALNKMESCDDFQSLSGSRDLDFLQRQSGDDLRPNSVIVIADEHDEHGLDDTNKSLLNEDTDQYKSNATNSVTEGFGNNLENSSIKKKETIVEESDIDDKKKSDQKQNDLQNFVQKKSIAQGMMDLALVSANTNQLRYVIDMSERHPYFFTSIFLILTSLVLQVVVGLGLIWNSRYNIRKKQEMDRADKFNNLSIIGVFLITLINVFISTFNGSSAATVTDTKTTTTTELSILPPDTTADAVTDYPVFL